MSVVNLLLSKSEVDLNIRNLEDDVPLHYACLSKEVEVVKLLLSKPGVDVNMKNSQSDTPLHYACVSGEVSVIDFLLSRPQIEVNIQNSKGETPLLSVSRVLCEKNELAYMGVISALLKRSDIRVTLENKKGFVAAHYIETALNNNKASNELKNIFSKILAGESLEIFNDIKESLNVKKVGIDLDLIKDEVDEAINKKEAFISQTLELLGTQNSLIFLWVQQNFFKFKEELDLFQSNSTVSTPFWTNLVTQFSAICSKTTFKEKEEEVKSEFSINLLD